MTSQNLESKVIQIISTQLAIESDDISGDSNFVEDLGADSLDIVELVMEIEDEFDLEIPDEDVENLSTVQDVVNYLNKNIQAKT